MGVSRHTCGLRPDKPMKLGLINSAFQQVGVDTPTGLKHISRIEFDSVELEYSPNPAKFIEWVEEACRETAKLMDLVGLRTLLLMDYSESNPR